MLSKKIKVVGYTDDYEITSSFPEQPKNLLRQLIEYRIKQAKLS